MKKNRQNPRKTALKIIDRFFSGGGSLKDIISEALDASGLRSLDRRFVFNLAKGTVRYYLRSDYLISILSSRKLEKIDPSILNILRMGIYQVQFMDSVPDYSAVDESVRLARNTSRAAPGFVNAVMRKVTGIKDPEAYIKGMLGKDGRSREDIISVMYSFPSWIIDYWAKYFGIGKAERICSSLNKIPLFYIRSDINRFKEKEGRLDPGSGYQSLLLGELEKIGAVPVELDYSCIKSLESGIARVLGPLAAGKTGEDSPVFGEAARIRSAMGIEKEKLYRDGIITVQDLSSQMAIKYFLAPEKDEKILDCCAAPGGKTSFAAQIMENSGRIVAVDKSSGKIKLIEKNLERLGIQNTDTFLSDASRAGFLKGMEGASEGYFDRMIVDAPCTALGTIAKNPEVKYNRSASDIKRLSGLSVKLLSACHPYLRPGGKILFYTCTISPEENGKAVMDFIDQMAGEYCIARAGGIDMELEIMPYYLDSEGGYACVLEKKR